MGARRLSYLFLGDEELLFMSGSAGTGGGYEIRDFVQKDLPSHVIEGGIIADEDELRDLLQEIKKVGKAGKRGRGKLFLVLPDCLVDSKFLQVPYLSGKELSNYLDVEAERLVGGQLSDSIVDYSVLSSRQKILNLHLAAVSRPVISAYQELMWEFFSRCHGITFRGDIIWPLIINLSLPEGIILLEAYADSIYISAAREGFMYLYREERLSKENHSPHGELLDIVKKTDSYLQQELNQPHTSKIYFWEAGMDMPGEFTYPRQENGHSWHDLGEEKLQLQQCEKLDEFLQIPSSHILPAVGMMMHESR